MSSPLSLFSPHTAASRAQPRASENGGAVSHSAVAGPLAGVRVPQRVSAPPSSGLAAAPPWPSSAKNFPARSSSPSPAKQFARCTARSFSLSSSPFGFELFFSIFFSLVHPKRGSGVRVRLNPIRVFFLFLFFSYLCRIPLFPFRVAS